MTGSVLFAIYGTGLVLVALVIEWLSLHTHKRALRFRTAGFTYDDDHDHWICPVGEHLWPHEYDHERRLVRYQAKAHICNGCPRKVDCTDSETGREIVRPADPWPHSEAGRFHRGVAVLICAIAISLLIVGLVTAKTVAVAVVILVLIAAAVTVLVLLARDLRRHPAGFPDPTATTAMRVAVTGADGVRPESRWASVRLREQADAGNPDEHWATLWRKTEV